MMNDWLCDCGNVIFFYNEELTNFFYICIMKCSCSKGWSTEYSTFLESCIRKELHFRCIHRESRVQWKMQARFGEGFFDLFFVSNKEIIYSIRLVPGSSPGQPILISISKSCVYIVYINVYINPNFWIHFSYSKKRINLDREEYRYLWMLLLVDMGI